MAAKNETWRGTDIITTERLKLVPWEDTEADAREIFRIASNPNIGPHAGWKPHESLEESRTILRELFLPFGGGNDAFSIRLKDTGRVIGNISVYEDSARENVKSLEIGYWLDEAEWHKGYMTEACKAIQDYAFLKYDLAIMAIRTSNVNMRSQGVIRNCGFTYEGTIRKAYHIYTGEDRDSRIYSITREEWEAR